MVLLYNVYTKATMTNKYVTLLATWHVNGHVYKLRQKKTQAELLPETVRRRFVR